MKYFAYGSCMNQRDFLRTAPKAIKIGPATLYNYRLGFTHKSRIRNGGVADILKAKDECVEGILYDLNEREVLALDAREGAPFVYRRKNILVELPDGKRVRAFTYEVTRKLFQEVPPSLDYASLIWTGAAELSQSYQKKLRNLLFGNQVESYFMTASGEWNRSEI